MEISREQTVRLIIVFRYNTMTEEMTTFMGQITLLSMEIIESQKQSCLSNPHGTS